jgi:hypothetical protein
MLEDEKNDIRGGGQGSRIRRHGRNRRSSRSLQHIASWRTLWRGDVVAIFLLAAFVGIPVITVVKFPNFGWTNLGAGALRFRSEWECSQPGYGDPVCVKKPAPSQ